MFGFTPTSQISETLLIAITENETYSQYFADDTVLEMIENTKNNNSTYYELFSMVEAMYNIANSVIVNGNEVEA